MALGDQVTRFLLTAVDQTGAGVSSADKGLNTLQNSARSLNGVLAALGVGVSFAGIVAGVKSIVNELDDAAKSAQKVGLSVEAFTGLKYAADLSGVSVETLSTAVGKLNRNMLEAAENGTSEQGRAFANLGIQVTDAEGRLRAADDVLIEVANRFSSMPDGVEKSALAMQVFGKSGAELIPLLNSGADGIRAMTDEAQELGKVMSTEAAQAAERFNDNLTRIQASAKGLAIEAVEKLTPALVNITDAMAQAVKEGGILKALWVGLGGVFSEVTGLGKAATELDKTRESLELLHQRYRDGKVSAADYALGVRALEEKIRDLEAAGRDAKDVHPGESIATDLRLAEEAAKAAAEAFREMLAQRKAEESVIASRNALATASLQLSLEEAKTAYEVAKAKGDEGAAREANARVVQLEIDIANLKAKIAIAEAEQIVETIKLKLEEAKARGENVAAQEKELEAAELNVQLRKKQSEITGEVNKRTAELNKITQETAPAMHEAAGGMEHFGQSAGFARREVDALTESTRELTEETERANKARLAATEANWEGILARRGIKLTADELARFKAIIEEIYKTEQALLAMNIDGGFTADYQNRSTQNYFDNLTFLLDESIRKALEAISGGSGTATGNTSTGGGSTTTNTRSGQTGHGTTNGQPAGGIVQNVTITVPNFIGTQDDLARALQPALDRITRLNA